jgi:chemotaxis protein methyltransferase CheR
MTMTDPVCVKSVRPSRLEMVPAGAAPHPPQPAGSIRSGLTARQFDWIAATVYGYCGIYLAPAKRQSVEGRLRSRVRALGFPGLTGYLDYLMSGEGQSQEFVHFIDCITINKTEFFREPDHFSLLQERLLPELLDSCGAGKRYPLRIWSAGCSSGEEPYTIAMTVNEFASSRQPYRFSVLATDISQRVLEKAARAVYPLESFDPIAEPLRRKYLLRNRDEERSEGRIAPEIRKLVEFRRLNLTGENLSTGGPLDIIFCRNVMIYFTKSVREALIERLSGRLRVGGYLIAGHSETLGTATLPMAPVVPTVCRRTA